MHEHVLHVLRVWLAVVLRAKTGEAFVTEVCFNGIKAFNQDVYSEIEFFLIYQYRRFDIPLYEKIRVAVGPKIFGNIFKLVN